MKLSLTTDLFNPRTMMRSIFATNPYRTRLGQVFAFNSSGVGVLNSVISNLNIVSLPEFSSFQGIFDEFFVHAIKASYVPRSRYQFPIASPPTTTTTNCLLTATPLYHGTAGYTSASNAMNNSLTEVHSSGDPFVSWWENNEDPSMGIMVSPSVTLPTASQSWCSTVTAAASLYEGQIQYLGSTPIGAGAAVVTVGDFAVTYDIAFRVRA
jgi:hypothetical protein